MTSLDWILVAILVSSTVAGFLSGFARVTIGLAAGIFGILFGFWFYRLPGAWFAEYFESKTAASVLGFVFVFGLVLVVGGLLSKLMAKLFKWAGLSWLDRLLGGAFGLVRGMIVVTGIVTIVTAFAPNPPPRWIAHSEVMPYATGFAKVLAAVAPRELKEQFDVNLDRIKRIWSDNLKPSPSASPAEQGDEPKKKLKKESY